MSELIIELIPILTDNYVYALHDPDSGETAVVDPGEAAPVQKFLAEKGWDLSLILLTHHHGDHIGGTQDLRSAFGAKSPTVAGAAADAYRLPPLDIALTDGDSLTIGCHVLRVMATPGHTLGHLTYWLPDDRALFCGDTLFSLGCGRLFEGTAAQMWDSLSRLRALPDDTRIYCTHEYTQSNGRFALSLDPDNPALRHRVADVDAARAKGCPTLPALLSSEKAANPFLRADAPALCAALSLSHAPAVDVFADIRRRKDVF